MEETHTMQQLRLCTWQTAHKVMAIAARGASRICWQPWQVAEVVFTDADTNKGIGVCDRPSAEIGNLGQSNPTVCATHLASRQGESDAHFECITSASTT
eukprot:1119981-Amphidinium_carterae.1